MRRAQPRRPAQSPAPMLAFMLTIVLLTITVIVGGVRWAYGVDLPTFFQSVRAYNEAQATAEAGGVVRPTAQIAGPQDAPRPHQTGADAPWASSAGERSPAAQEPASVAPVERVPVAGHEDAAPQPAPTPEPKLAPEGKEDAGAVVQSAEPGKPAPQGKAEPTPPAKVRGGKGTP